MRENPLRSHALKIERFFENGQPRFRYQHSPVFTDLKTMVEWIKDNLEELEHASA